MAAAFIASATANNTGSGTGLNASPALNIATGDIILAWVSWFGGASTITVSDGGSNSLTMETTTVGGGTEYGTLGYKLVGVANATATFAMTLGTARTYREINVLQFRPDAGDTIARDAANSGTSAGTAWNSNAITTGGASPVDVIVVGGGFCDAVEAPTSAQIGGVAATGQVGSIAGIWYRILTSNMSSGAATGTTSSGEWVCQILSIKSDAPGGGPVASTIPAGPVGSNLRW